MKKVVFGALMSLLIGLTSCFDTPDSSFLTFEEQLEVDIKVIDDYLESNEIKVEVHESGIRYFIEEPGEGAKASEEDQVEVIYEGRFTDGTVFDSDDIGASFALDALIVAWQLTIPLIEEGGKITIFAPSGYCYGRSGRGQIPPNSVLFFDIELVKVN